jgi:hypothetical protein
MKCFEVDEATKVGLRIARFPEAHVPIRGATPLLFDPKLAEFISEIPKELGELKVTNANLMLTDRSIRLAPEPPEWKDSKALVRVTTQTTVSGSLLLTAGAYAEEERDGKVVRLFLPFPPPGVKVVLGSTEPAQLYEGAIGFDLFIVMEPGAEFRITRSGDLQGASPELFVRWYGDGLVTRAPGRHHPKHRRRRSRSAGREGLPGPNVAIKKRA